MQKITNNRLRFKERYLEADRSPSKHAAVSILSLDVECTVLSFFGVFVKSK
jgi:hypothetical protein